MVCGDSGEVRPSAHHHATRSADGVIGFQTTALLCLNPSLTFFFFQAFRKLLLKGSHRANPSPREAFIGAALSNVIGT